MGPGTKFPSNVSSVRGNIDENERLVIVRKGHGCVKESAVGRFRGLCTTAGLEKLVLNSARYILLYR